MVLERHFRSAFELLYGGKAETRFYALVPPVVSNVASGVDFDLRLTLIGPATCHMLACTQALAKLGEMGLRPAGHYRLEAAVIIGPEGDLPYYTHADGLLRLPTAHDLHDYLGAPSTAQRLRLRLVTPLRLKEGNDLLRTTPRFDQIIHRLSSRMDQLAHAMNVAPPISKTARALLFEEARQVLLVKSNVRWESLDRRSGRSGQQMNFGGLMGEIEYEGDFTQTFPWLMAGRWLHVGGKPAFGFGSILVEPLN